MAGVMARLGVERDDATSTADALIHADLRGVDSHGINMFTHNRAYVPGLRDGSVNRSPRRRVLHETPSTALLDNDVGLGAAGASAAMELAVAKAANVGSGFVAVTNGRHYGMAAHYAMQALPHGRSASPSVTVGPRSRRLAERRPCSARTQSRSPRRPTASRRLCSTWRRAPSQSAS